MSKAVTTPGSVLVTLMLEYNLSIPALSKAVSLSQSLIRQIIVGKTKISVPTALRLSKYFDRSPDYWLDLQKETDLRDAAIDQELSTVLKGISKVKKSTTKEKSTAKPVAKKASSKTSPVKDS